MAGLRSISFLRSILCFCFFFCFFCFFQIGPSYSLSDYFRQNFCPFGPWIFICKASVRDFCHIQSTLVISKSKGLSEILRDIRVCKYQICRIEEKINRTITFHN